MEINDYFTIGSGSDVAKGVLYATQDSKNPFERIVTAIQAAADSTLYVDEDVNILATEMKKTDTKLIAKALGLDLKALEQKEITEENPAEDFKKIEETKD